MPPPSDEELIAALGEDYEAQERSRRNRQAMNALLRGQSPPEEQDPADDSGHTDESPDARMNAAIRRASGRTYKTKEQDS